MFVPQMEIYPGVHQIPGITANVYLIVDPNGLALIDTHADHDHYGGLAKLVTITKAISSSSAIEAEAMLNST